MIKNKFIYLLGLILLFQTNLTNAQTSFLQEVTQPQLKVVKFNENIESVRQSLLDPVSIFLDRNLYVQWNNILIGMLVIMFSLIFLQIGLSVFKWSKDNLKKYGVSVLIVFLVGSLYAPVFSKVSEFSAWSDTSIITDKVSGENYSRIYLPANTAISVEPYYIKDWWTKVELWGKNTGSEWVLQKRNDDTIWSWEYLGVPAKVAQTQWQSLTDPTDRASTAFYWVNIDTLMKGSSLNYYIPEDKIEALGILKEWNQCSVAIQPELYSDNPFTFYGDSSSADKKLKNIVLTFLEATWNTKWLDQVEAIKSSLNNDYDKALDHIPESLRLNFKYITGGGPVKITSWDSWQSNYRIPLKITRECNKFPLGLYLMSDQWLSNIGWRNSQVETTGEQGPAVLSALKLYNNSFTFFKHKASILLDSESYINQKKILYTWYAYLTLDALTRQDPGTELKSNTSRLKEAALWCGRILMWTVQEAWDYKRCLLSDQVWDTTLYTFDTTTKIWLAWLNKNINQGYILPVPVTMDWDRQNIALTYGDLKSLLDDPSKLVNNAIQKAADATSNAVWWGVKNVWTVTKNVWSATVWVVWNILKFMPPSILYFWPVAIYDMLTATKDSSTLDSIREQLKSKSIDTSAFTPEQLVWVFGWLLQRALLNSYEIWFYNSAFEPQLASFESYDLNGDGKRDYDNKVTFTPTDKTTSYYSYHFWSSIPSLSKDSVNFLQKPTQRVLPLETNQKFKMFQDMNTWESKLVTEDSGKLKQVDVQWYTIGWEPDWFVNPLDDDKLKVLFPRDQWYQQTYVPGKLDNASLVLKNGVVNTPTITPSTTPWTVPGMSNDNEWSTIKAVKDTLDIKWSQLFFWLQPTVQWAWSTSQRFIGNVTPTDTKGSKFEVKTVISWTYTFFPFSLETDRNGVNQLQEYNPATDTNVATTKYNFQPTWWKIIFKNKNTNNGDQAMIILRFKNQNNEEVYNIYDSKKMMWTDAKWNPTIVTVPLTYRDSYKYNPNVYTNSTWKITTEVFPWTTTPVKAKIEELNTNDTVEIHNIYTTNVWWKSINVEEIPMEKYKFLNQYDTFLPQLYLRNDTNLTDSSLIYTYVKMDDNSSYSIPVQYQRTINELWTPLQWDWTQIKTIIDKIKSNTTDVWYFEQTWQNGLEWANQYIKIPGKDPYIVPSGKTKRDQVDWKLGYSQDTKLHVIDYNVLGKEFYLNDNTKSLNPRVLLNPNINIPLKWTTPWSWDYPKYKESDWMCLITWDVTDTNQDLFDNYSDSNVKFNYCSKVGDHKRVTDVRLQSYRQLWSVLALWTANKDIMTHIAIPLLDDTFMENFSWDRRDQRFAWEEQHVDDLLNGTRVSWLPVQEGDVMILKPGVVIWAFNHPFTIVVPSSIVPYLKYSRLDSTTSLVSKTKEYSGGLYELVSSIWTSVWNIGTSIKGTIWNITNKTDKERYKEYLNDKFLSRPDILKNLEWDLPARFFHAYYGDSYFNDIEALKSWGTVWWISTWLFGMLWGFLHLRVSLLGLLLVFSPILTMSLLFPASRRIFTWTVAITLFLVFLPVVTIWILNLIPY